MVLRLETPIKTQLGVTQHYPCDRHVASQLGSHQFPLEYIEQKSIWACLVIPCEQKNTLGLGRWLSL